MAKKVKEEEIRQQNVAEAVSKTEEFFNKNSKYIYGCITAVLVIALLVICYNRFILQPKKAEAMEQMVQAETWFAQGDYETALNGDGNFLGFLDIIDQYGAKGGQSVYFYAGVASLQTGAYDDAISFLKKYKGEDPILLARAQSCIGDAYVNKEEVETAIQWFKKAAKTAFDTPYAAEYLIKAGIAAESLGMNDEALSFYKEVKDRYATSPEAAEIDKYITRIQNAQ